MKKEYLVLADGWIGGRLLNKGERVSLTDNEAKYLLLSGQIGETSAAAKGTPAKPLEKPATK